MKEYQTISEAAIVLPHEVYHECLWIVRDMPRMEKTLQGCLFREPEELPPPAALVEESLLAYPALTEYRGQELSGQQEELIFRLNCIHNALEQIPEEYRLGVLHSIQHRGQLQTSELTANAHETTWRRWKQRFIYALARNLHLC